MLSYGDLSLDLILNSNGNIYLVFRNKRISVLDSNGNLNVKIKSIIKSGTPGTNSDNGIYYDGNNVYIKFGNDIKNITGQNSSQLPQGSIIRFKGKKDDTLPTGWHYYGDTDMSGVIYIINMDGETYTVSEVKLSWNPDLISTSLHDLGFILPTLQKQNPGNVPLSIEYSSDNPLVATIDGNGNITLKSAGSANIKAVTYANSLHNMSQASYTLTINKDEISAFFALSSKTISVGESFTPSIIFKLNNLVYNGSVGDYYFTSNNSNAVLINGTNITGKGKGTAKIKIHLNLNNWHDSFVSPNNSALTLTVKSNEVAVESITINPSSFEILSGGTQLFSASVLPTNATNKTITWSIVSGDATINLNGLLTAGNVSLNSTVTIKATANNGVSKTCTGTVKPNEVAVESVTVSPSSFEVLSGGTQLFSATVLPSNATTKSVIWRVTQGNATIDSSGKLTAGNVTTDTTVVVEAVSNDTSGSTRVSGTSRGTIKAPLLEPESNVKSFKNIIDEFNATGIYSPNITSTGTTGLLYSYLDTMYNNAKSEYEGNSELFLSSTYENLEVYNYHGTNNQYELDGTAENAMFYWLIAMCLSELVPSDGSNNKLTRLFKFAYDLGEESGHGRKFRLYNNYTPKGDLTICRLVASVIYAKYRSNYKNLIPTFRSNLGGRTISISGTLQDGLGLSGKIGSSPTKYGYSVDLDLIFPAAAGPYSSSYTNRLNLPLTQQGENHDDFNSTTLNYVIDETINNTVVNNYNLRTSNSNILKRAILAISDDYEEVEHYLDDKIYYTYPDNPGNDVTYPHDRFRAPTSSSNKGYFTGTFNNSVVTSKNLSLYKNSSNFTNFLSLMKNACAWNRQTTFWPQYGRKRPSQGSNGCGCITDTGLNGDCGCITDIGLHSDQNWLDDWGILNLAGGSTKYDLAGDKHYVDRKFPGNKTDNREDNESSYYTHNCDYVCSTTYPSGHSGGVWGAALALIELLSDMGITNSTEINNIYKAAYAFTVSRTIVRAHWNSDTIYGKLNTTTIFPVLHAMSTFDNMFNNAKLDLNNTPSNKHNIDIAYSSDWTSPEKTGVKGAIFNLPTLYIKENNTKYSSDGTSYIKYPYWDLLKQYITYRLGGSNDTNYASINSTTGAVTLNNITGNYPASGNHLGDGITVFALVGENSMFTTTDAHFYVKIVKLVGDTQIDVIINNLTGEDAYITGEILYFVKNSINQVGIIVTCSDENIANDPDGSGDGEPNNITLIKLNPGENLLHFSYVEYPVSLYGAEGAFDKTKSPFTFISCNDKNNAGTQIQLTLRVYAHGKGENHIRAAFKSTIAETTFTENGLYHITIEKGDSNYDYDLMYKPSTPTSSISVSPSSVSFQASGGTSSVSVTTNSSTWSATSGANWCTTNKSGNTLSISASANTESRRTTTITITDGNNNTATVNVSQSGAGGDEISGKFAVVSDIHINNETKRDYFKTFVDYCVSNNISYIACSGDLLESDGPDFNYLNPAILYATSKGITFLSCYGNHDSNVIYDLYHRIGGESHSANMTSLQIENGLNNLNAKSGIIINEIPNLGMFIYLSVNYNYPGTTFWSDGASCGSTALSDEDIQSLLGICGSGCGYTSADKPYNYQYYSTSDLISLALTLESNQSLIIYLFSHHPFRHKAALDAYSYDGGIPRINPYKKYSTTDKNNGFNSMKGWGSNTLTGILFYFLNWLNNKYKNVIWFTGHNHQPWGSGHNYSYSDSYIIKPSGSNTNNYSTNSSNGITSALNINLPSLKSTQEAGIVEVNDSGIKLNEIKISGSTASKTGEYSYTFDRNYPYSNPPSISYDNVPDPTPGDVVVNPAPPSPESGTTKLPITFRITNNLSETALLCGDVVINLSQDPNATWDNNPQSYAAIRNKSDSNRFRSNYISIPPGGTFLSTAYITKLHDTGPHNHDLAVTGGWYLLGPKKTGYGPVYLYTAHYYGDDCTTYDDKHPHNPDNATNSQSFFLADTPSNRQIYEGAIFDLHIIGTMKNVNPNRTVTYLPDNSGYYVIKAL